MRKWLSALLVVLFAATPSLAEKWSFAVFGDNRSAFSSYRNVLERIRQMAPDKDGNFPPVDFVLACGDISPVARNDDLYREVFKGNPPPFFPVRGNHETAEDRAFIVGRLLAPRGETIKARTQGCVTYFTDWKNVRLIVLDQYCDFDKILGNSMALKWLEEMISTATAEHVFIAMHEPLLSSDFRTDDFWKILLRHPNKVRAVFAGHIHSYARKRIPDEGGKLYYINVGNAGWTSHSDNKQTFVTVMIDAGRASAQVLQARDGTTDFKIRDQWSLSAPSELSVFGNRNMQGNAE